MSKTQEDQKHIFNDEGKPFDTIEEALSKAEADELDLRRYVPQKYRNGFVLLDLKAAKLIDDDEPSTATKKKQRYVKVQFSQKGHKNDLNHVPLTVNGNELRAPRGVPTILPWEYVMVAEHATQSSWDASDNPEVAAIPGAPVQRYPFTIIDDDVSEEEYRKHLAEGNKQTREALEKAQSK